jgi:hypothetical protein
MDYKPPQNNEEPADRLIEEFRQDSVERPPDFAEKCAMTAKVMDYALNEAEPQERAEIREHLITCRVCMKLYFDTCMTKTWAEESSLQTVPMSAELQAAIQKQSAPAWDWFSKFQKVFSYVPRYLFFITTRQRLASSAAGFAMVCLATWYLFVPAGQFTANITATAEQMTARNEASQTAAHPINPGDRLKADERLHQIKITTNKDVYGYVILAYASGDVKTLYSGEFKADRAKSVLGTEEQVKLDYHSGRNMIFLIAKDDPIPDFDKKIKELEPLDTASIQRLFPDASLHHFGYERE